MVTANLAIWGIATLTTAGVIVRPLGLSEAVWAVLGAVALVCFGLLPLDAAFRGVGKGLDVYLFLTGMMLLAEVARDSGLFDWLASLAASHARGSPTRLFQLIYGVGIVVTVFLSNDATAVVLTPAVAAVARSCKIAQPLPYLVICAFIANAASFVLPISNPANLVIFASQMPPLLQWLARFTLPSVLAISSTYFILRYAERHTLARTEIAAVSVPTLTAGGRTAAIGIVCTAAILTVASALGWQLGLPTCVAGVATLVLAAGMKRASPVPLLRHVSWGVIPLVAGLFVLVEGLDQSGVIGALSDLLRTEAQRSESITAGATGVLLGFVSNVINNLPAGLIAGTAVQNAHVPASVASAALVGVDLGPNLSVTGSLATLLWLSALRREGIQIKGADFFKLGLLVMPPALLLSLAAVGLAAVFG